MEIIDFAGLFNEEELFALRELNIEPSLLVFNQRALLSLPFLQFLKLPFTKDRQFVCHLKIKDGLYHFELPKKLPRKFKKSIAVTERRLLATNNSHMKRLMESAKKNAEFIGRFNSELFLKHSFYKGKRIAVAELSSFYKTVPYCQTIDLSAESDRQPFIALYAMAFYACSPADLFTIDGIFSLQPERHADNAKKTAGNSVFNLILRDDKAEMEQVLSQMGQTLADIQPPRVNLSDTVMISKNYTLFNGLSEMGRVYNQVTASANFTSFRAAAVSLMNYAALVRLCDTISIAADDEDYRESAVYKKCKSLFS
ncbi:MAG: hypothetical protein FWH07_03710 [Oscillospiraceae bacterium]|nr:hypothetical protein [Oscillospiraceae bacterium]